MADLMALVRRRYLQRQRLAQRTVRQVRREWARLDPAHARRNLALMWRADGVAAAVYGLISAAQYEAASTADASTGQLLAAQGIDPAAAGAVVPGAFSGVASDGRDLSTLLDQAVVHSLRALQVLNQPDAALQVGGQFLELVAGTQVADAGRVADGVTIAARREVAGWVRMLSPPSCSRCVVLAGKFYRWNAGFERHPRCDCLHIPASEDAAGELTTDPKAYFNSLSTAEQDKTFGKAGAQAIRDGADISQVVNVRTGMQTASVGGREVLITTTGTTKRGYFAYVQRAMDAQRGQDTQYTAQRVGRRGYVKNSVERRAARPRLMPEQIYRIAGGDREEAIRLLAGNGYLVQGVQNDAARALSR